MTDWRYHAFIRSNSFTKVIDMFGAERITEVVLNRRVQKQTKREVLPDDPHKPKYLQRDITETHSFCVDWTVKKHGGIFPSDKVKMLVTKADIGDLVVAHVQFRFESPELATYLNDELARINKAKVFTPKSQFYATFENYYGEELKSLPFLAMLNHFEIENYMFKLSCLDLTDLHTDRKEKYGEDEHLPIHDDARMLDIVLKGLNWDGWDRKLRTMKDGQVIRPAAKRQYKKTQTKNWILEGQQEVK